jgi:hypothetical protein
MTVAINTGASVDTTTTPAPEGHDAAMIAKVDAQASTAPADGGQTSTTTPAADRPAWLPEKFATAEDFAKSYAALEAKLGGGDKAPTADTTKPATTEIPTADAARDQVTQAGLDFDAINAEFAKDGKLSDATYDRLAKAGHQLAPPLTATSLASRLSPTKSATKCLRRLVVRKPTVRSCSGLRRTCPRRRDQRLQQGDERRRHQRHEAGGRWSEGSLHRSQRHHAQAAQWRLR